MLGAPGDTQDAVMQSVNLVLMMLSALGVLIDPTTAGGSTDSARALQYTEPNPRINDERGGAIRPANKEL